jgi:hypothetical protein
MMYILDKIKLAGCINLQETFSKCLYWDLYTIYKTKFIPVMQSVLFIFSFPRSCGWNRTDTVHFQVNYINKAVR